MPRREVGGQGDGGAVGALGRHGRTREVTALLVAAGADLHLRDPEFDATPAGWAREGGHDELADRLNEKE